MVHGMAGHSHWWDSVAPILDRRLRPVALDISGHGDSVWKEDGRYTTQSWIADIEEARRTLGADQMVLIGHSLGARLCLEYARKYPERLSALVAVDFLPELPDSKRSKFERGAARPQPYYADPESLLSRFRLEPRETTIASQELRQLAQASIKETPQGHTWKFDWRCLSYPYKPIWPVLAEIHVPTLLVRGALSRIMSRPVWERMVQEIDGAEGVEIDGAHHHIPLDRPLPLAQAIDLFLRNRA
jgi:pimeloyl-ACP methyl ester carboxylesterase